MKCINRPIIFLTGAILFGTIFSGCEQVEEAVVTPYEMGQYNTSLYRGGLFSSDLCVTNTNVDIPNYATDATLHAAALFGVNQKQVYYADRIHERLFPASTTKILTAYLALKYGNLSDPVTISAHATTELPAGSSVAGFKEGDQTTLEDLLYGLMLPSGNDSAVAIAEKISGSVEAFAELMNQEAMAMGATNSHFVNPHGFQDENHYTTAYDLYLIFNQCIKDERFLTIVAAGSHTTVITGADGVGREVTWNPTNYFAQGKAVLPGNVTLAGGKTGTTDEAGSCLILLTKDQNANPYISIIMGGSTKAVLYNDMTALIGALPVG
ncbi:MAG: D-alanyl-D-alanine carboxypeptidase [Lachnospiraceae bacterium]